MTCPREEQIDRMLGNSLTPEDLLALKQHLELCAECQEAMERAEGENRAFRELLSGYRLSSDLPTAAGPRRRSPARGPLLVLLAPVAALALVVLVLWAILGRERATEETSGPSDNSSPAGSVEAGPTEPDRAAAPVQEQATGNPEPQYGDLILRVREDGTCLMGKKRLIDGTQPSRISPLIDVFEQRRTIRELQEIPGVDKWVKYTLFLKVDSGTPVLNVQKLMALARYRGAIIRITLLSDEPGVFARVSYPQPIFPPKERSFPLTVRVLLCADGDVKRHRASRRSHLLAAPGLERCTILVEEGPPQLLVEPESGSDVKSRNREAVRKAVDSVDKHCSEEGVKKKDCRVELDADGSVPFRHVLRVISLLRAEGFSGVTILRNPALAEYTDPAKGKLQKKR